MEINVCSVNLGGFNVCYLTPDQVSSISDQGSDYALKGLKDGSGDYYFIQINKDLKIENRFIVSDFKKGTIFFLRKKDSETAHYFLAKTLLGLEDELLLSAGELIVKDEKMVSWNLKTGYYWDKLKLNTEEVPATVGLPMKIYTKVVNSLSTALAELSLLGSSNLKSEPSTEENALLNQASSSK